MKLLQVELDSLNKASKSATSNIFAFNSRGETANRVEHLSGVRSRRIDFFDNFIGYIVFQRPDNGKFDAFKIVAQDSHADFLDEHSANFNAIQFAGRNEPVHVYYQGNDRKFEVNILLCATRRYSENENEKTVATKMIKDISRDNMSIIDVDFITRMAMSLTYSSYSKSYSAPKRVWLTYGNFIKMIPCVVNSVSRIFLGKSPVDKSIKYVENSYLPMYQTLSFRLTACPESLLDCPDAIDIAKDSNANGAYGKDIKAFNVKFKKEQHLNKKIFEDFDKVRRVNLFNELKRRAASHSRVVKPLDSGTLGASKSQAAQSKAAEPLYSSSSMLNDINNMKNSVTQYANIANQFIGFGQQQLNDIINKSLPNNKVRLYL